MKRYALYIQTLAPVAITDTYGESILSATKDFIPGSAIRGLVAQQLLSSLEPATAYEDDTFHSVILSGAIQFLPAYPIGNCTPQEAEPFILPRSLMQEKATGKLRDMAAPNTTWQAGLKKINGFAVQQQKKMYPVTTKKQSHLHIQRTTDNLRLLGHSNDGNIFNYEYIEPHQTFKGYILVDDSAMAYTPLLEKLLGNTELHLGRSRSAQYGLCHIRLVEVPLRSMPAFTDSMPVYLYHSTPYMSWTDWDTIETPIEEILTSLSERVPALGTLPMPKRIWGQRENVSGYVSVWKARYEQSSVISAGSVWELPLTPAQRQHLPALSAALHRGLGRRTEEGYGQLQLWAPLTQIEFAQVEPISAPATLHSETQKLARSILRERMLQEVGWEAAKAAKTLNKSSNHVLKRIEDVVHQYKTQQAIVEELNKWRSTARQNLQNLFLKENNDVISLFNALREPRKNNYDWHYLLGMTREEWTSLQKTLGINENFITADDIYYTYWLWFARHARKKG